MDQQTHRLVLPGLHMHLEGVSVAGVCTSLQIPEARLAVDIGVLTPRATRMPFLALTHAHADHAGAIANYLSHRRLLAMGPSTIFAPPAVCAPLEALIEAWVVLQGFPFDATVRPALPGERLPLRRPLFLEAFATDHVVPSCGYVLCRRRDVLRPEHQGKPGAELGRLRAAGEIITDERIDPLVAFSGDTRPGALAASPLVRRARVLVCELTFLGEGGRAGLGAAEAGGHVHIDELLTLLEALECKHLVIMHLSLKHSVAEARAVLDERLPADWRGRVSVFDHQDRRA